jgi:hypothetical protein
MFKKNKRGFELSLNLIIIVIIAFVFLGAAILLIKNWMKILNDDVPKILPPADALWQPTSDRPVMFSPSTIEFKKGSSKTITLQVYNYVTKDVTCSLNFTYVGDKAADSLQFVFSKANKAIPVDMVGEWKISIKASAKVAPDTYMYSANIDCGEFSRQSDLVITVQ